MMSIAEKLSEVNDIFSKSRRSLEFLEKILR
jgi:hypothetical protein